MVDFTKTRLWERTLGSTDAKSQDHLDRLRSAFLQFREHVSPLAADIALSVPDYTDHGIGHCDSLWDTASALTGEKFDLNPAEAFVLGGAFLVHDLGMGLSAYAGGLNEIASAPEFRDTVAEAYSDDFESILETVERDVATDNTWDGLTDPRAKSILTVYMRNRHAEQAAQIVSREWKMSNGQVMYLLADTTLRSFYGECIGLIARSHWLDVAELEATLPPSLGHIPGFPSEWTVNPVKVACILRLADAINIDASRAHPLHTPHRAPRADSLKHWQAQEKMLAAEVRDRRVYFTSGNVFGPELADAWWLLYDTVRLIDSELRRVDNLCADLELPRFDAHAAAGAESPARFSKFIRPVGWQPVDARPYIGDQNLVMKQLGGSSLYGSHGRGEVAFREILANAMDATRALRSAFPSANVRPILVRLERTDNGDVLSIRDFGIGMRALDISNALCNFGTSGWRGSAGRHLPGLVSSDFRPTGKFGIGFFASFMAASHVTVTSKHVDEAKTDTSILDFPHGLDDRPLIRPALRDEQFLESGTRVEMYLDRAVDEPEGLLSVEDRIYYQSFPTTEEFARVVRRLALTSDVDIDVQVDGGPVVRAISSNEWESASGEWLFDAMNSAVNLADDDYLAYRTEFARTVAPLHDDRGHIVARMSLSSPPLRLRFSGGVRSSRAYIGGVQAEESVEPFSGVSIGEAGSAVRREAHLVVPPAEVVHWFSEQVATAESSGLSPAQRLFLRVEALRLGIDKPDWELAWAKNGGALNDAQLLEWIGARDRFALMVGSVVDVPVAGGRTLLYESEEDEGMFILGDDHLVISEHYRSRRSSWSIRAIDAFAADDPGSFPWWSNVHDTPLAQVVRCAAVAWSVDLGTLAESLYFDFGSGSDEDRDILLRLDHLDGDARSIGAWIFEK